MTEPIPEDDIQKAAKKAKTHIKKTLVEGKKRGHVRVGLEFNPAEVDPAALKHAAVLALVKEMAETHQSTDFSWKEPDAGLEP